LCFVQGQNAPPNYNSLNRSTSKILAHRLLLKVRDGTDRATARGGMPRERHMDTYWPEISAYWESESSPAPGRENAEASSKQSLSAAQELALEELAERVSAARSIV
jgi:hypothetical protein